MQDQWDIIIVGNGIAGFSAAKAARQQSASCSVLLIGDEDRVPYKRTQLSKTIAAGFDRDAFQLQPVQWYEANRIQLMVAQRVVSISPRSHSLVLSSGETLRWSQLILATGSSPISPTFAQAGLPRVFVVRTAKAVEELIETVRGVDSVCIVGASVLGVEIAAQMVALGKKISLISNSSPLMSRHLDRVAADLLAKEFMVRGVDLIFDQAVENLTDGPNGRLILSLKNNQIETELCVFCTGVRSNVGLARAAELAVNRGILVDRCLRTSHPDVYAAGDVAEHPDGELTGLWHAAEDQGLIAGANAAGANMLNPQLPFRLKCEVFGRYFFSINRPSDSDLPGFEVRPGFAGSMYRCLYFRADILHGVVMVDDSGRARQYEAAVREGWVKDRVLAEFTL